jgi:hypothetical protein
MHIMQVCSAKSLHEMCEVFSVSPAVALAPSPSHTKDKEDTRPALLRRKRKLEQEQEGGADKDQGGVELVPDQRWVVGRR